MSYITAERRPLSQLPANTLTMTTGAGTVYNLGPGPANFKGDMNCDQVRLRLRNLVDFGEYKVKDLVAELGVSQTAYSRFMGQHGAFKGAGSDSYPRALDFLDRRTAQGLKDPTKTVMAAASKKRKSGDDIAQPGAKKQATGAKEEIVDVSDIHIPGQETDSVQVYETPREVRRKIGVLMRKPGVTQAAFLRTLAAQIETSDKKFQSGQLTRFRERSGVDAGISNPIFYAAYVYFEKLRIKEDKPKSKHREEMEKIWAKEGGLDLTRPSVEERGVYCHESKRPYVDEYGQLKFYKV